MSLRTLYGMTKFDEATLTCKPLDTYNELLAFINHPPLWGSLCVDLKPHSKYLLRNYELPDNVNDLSLETPLSFCHFNSEKVGNFKLYPEDSLPKTLVCHDLANGYLDDSVIDGTGSYDVYTFYNWAGIDIFCYFSHHLITIPPLAWINVGHEHGVKVIGTIITEWAEGIAFWSKVLASEIEMKTCIATLVAICKSLKFDGWLLNVENKVVDAEMLLIFVRTLHTTMHKELSDPVLIWYDSVTSDGMLNWQNKLNSKNKNFFDVCDGFFTNYSWTLEDVEESVLTAGSRLKDLYIGIDVWGRNFYGGGQFNTQEAVKVVYSFGCSLAIYGPSWTHEAMMSTNNQEDEGNLIENAENMSNYQKFLLRDRALWDSIWPFLNTRLPSVLPFKTSFCRGQGKKRRLYGDVICPAPWYNLKHMHYQPNAAHGPHGYQLSIQEVYSNVSRRETKGIIKLPDSMEKLAQLEETTPAPTTSERNPNEAVFGEESDEEPMHNIKEKIKSFFKLKSSSDDIETEEPLPISNSVISSGKSMLTMDVNIQLAPSTDVKTRVCLSYVDAESDCLEVYHDDSFIGGTCLKINPSGSAPSIHTTIRLFHCDFVCEETAIICVVTKNLQENVDQFLNVYLYAIDEEDREQRVTLIAHSLPLHNATNTANSQSFGAGKYPSVKTSKKFRDMQKYIMLNYPEFFVPLDNFYNWKVFYFEVSLPNVRITSINCRTGISHGAILLGHFGLCQMYRRDETISSNEETKN